MEQKVFNPSPEQKAFLDWIETGEGSCVLEAVAGAGKTTTLVEGVRRMKGQVFLGAYNTKMGAELKSRLAAMGFPAFGKEGKEAATFHSAGWKALQKSNEKLKNNKDAVDPDKVLKIVRKLFEDKQIIEEAGEIPAICQLVSLAKQTGFYVRGLVQEVKSSYWVELITRHDVGDRLPDDYDIMQLVSYADRVLKLSNSQREVVDFDDMCYLPLLWNLQFWPKDWVLIDEAQDTNATRREMARRMLRRNTGRLVAVGDPHQAIFGFTGADNRSLQLIRELFNAITLQLSVSWRCPTSVVAVARQYVDHIQPASTAAAGEVRNIDYATLVKTVSPGQAILCRFNAPLVELCFRLIREGKPAKIEGRAIGDGLIALVGRWKVKTLDAFEGRLEKWNARELAKAGDDEAKKARHDDKYATIMVLLGRARELKMTTVVEMQNMVKTMFEDSVVTTKEDGTKETSTSNLIILSTVHKSKGLEWPVVHILGRGTLMPSPYARQPWQQEQEVNLCYVAVTRAQQVLVDVYMPPLPTGGKK